MKDYNPAPCISFPLESGFGYKTIGFDKFVESNSFLVESQSNEFDLKKYKDLGGDLTVCFQFHDQHQFLNKLNGRKCVESYRRTPGLGFMIHNFMKNLGRPGISLDTIIDQILFEEIFSGNLAQSAPNENRRRNLDRIDVAKDYMHSNFQLNIGIDDISEVSCMSRFHFGRIFKEITGFTPYDYLTKVRLFNAREQLRKDENITGIAFQTGFNSLENFSHAFKREYNVSPLEFRSSLRKVY